MQYIYYKPHGKRIREAFFVDCLKLHFPTAIIISENATIDPSRLNLYVDKAKLLLALEKEQRLPPRAKQRCIDALSRCPMKLKVALDATRVSFDAVIENDGTRYYWEFHEEQHKNLTISRAKKVFSPAGEPTEVPRFLQRLVRDVWRVEHFQPYTIIWHNWFAQHHNEYKPSLKEGLHEHSLPDRFSFKNFWDIP